MKTKICKIIPGLLGMLVVLWAWPAFAANLPNLLRVNGVGLAYEVRGQGPPLLMIMGYAGTTEAWDPCLVKALTKDFSLILYDHRGMGRSGKWNKPVSLKMLAQDAHDLLKALGHEKVHVLGWSMGSMIAQELALAHPDQVAKLILYGTVYDNKPVMEALKRMGKATPKEFKAMMFPGDWLKQNPGIFRRLPHVSKRTDPAAVAAQAKAMALWPGTEDRLAKIAVPTLIVSGEEDGVTPAEQAVRMAGLIPGAWLARFKAGGHWLMYQNPLDLARLVKAFLLLKQNLLEPEARLSDGPDMSKAA